MTLLLQSPFFLLKFDSRSYCCKIIKNNRVKYMIQNVKFTMLFVNKTETTLNKCEYNVLLINLKK